MGRKEVMGTKDVIGRVEVMGGEDVIGRVEVMGGEEVIGREGVLGREAIGIEEVIRDGNERVEDICIELILEKTTSVGSSC